MRKIWQDDLHFDAKNVLGEALLRLFSQESQSCICKGLLPRSI